MKKLFGISLFAILAVVPLMASAADGDPVAGDPGQTATTAVQAEKPAGYSLAVQDSTKDGKMATAGYVKGAYNATIKAINRLAGDTANALNSKQDTISDIDDIRNDAAAGASAAENIGTMSALKGGETLVEAINAVKSTADAALTSAVLEDYITVDDLTEADYVTASDLQDAGYITSSALSGYATTSGVKSAINSSTATGTVDVLTTWGSDEEDQITITGNVSAAN